MGQISPDDFPAATARPGRWRAGSYEPRGMWGAPDSHTLNPDLIVCRDPLDPRTEQLRALRTRLLNHWSNPDGARRALAIVSPNSREGRSYLAANLAVLFAQLGHRTLLIDADLRAPRQFELFNVHNRLGLAAVLAGRLGREAAVAVPAFGPLFVLPAGTVSPNPPELLLRPALSAFVRFVDGLYDVILLDSPPARRHADAQDVAFSAGSALVLARAGHTRVDETAGTVQALGEGGVRVLGTVLNVF